MVLSIFWTGEQWPRAKAAHGRQVGGGQKGGEEKAEELALPSAGRNRVEEGMSQNVGALADDVHALEEGAQLGVAGGGGKAGAGQLAENDRSCH